MIVIIAGSRTIPVSVAMFAELEYAIVGSGFNITQVVGGKARGADRLGEEWAKLYGVPFKPFFPQYRDHDGERNPHAPFERNRSMAFYAASECLDGGGLVALMYEDEPTTSGTTDMIERARKHGLAVHVHLITPQQRTRYWHHPESSSYLTTAPGEEISETLAMEGVEITHGEYIANTNEETLTMKEDDGEL